MFDHDVLSSSIIHQALSVLVKQMLTIPPYHGSLPGIELRFYSSVGAGHLESVSV